MTASFDRGVWCYRLWEGVWLWPVDGVTFVVYKIIKHDFVSLK